VNLISCAILSIVLPASADSQSVATLAGFSAWKNVPLERKPGMMWRHVEANDFQDTRFEYRWKSEWTVNDYVCTVEIRPSDDADQSYTIPELYAGYSDPNKIGLHFHMETAHDVPIGKASHGFLQLRNCVTVQNVSWRLKP
jgi:hypothetical protein